MNTNVENPNNIRKNSSDIFNETEKNEDTKENEDAEENLFKQWSEGDYDPFKSWNENEFSLEDNNNELNFRDLFSDLIEKRGDGNPDLSFLNNEEYDENDDADVYFNKSAELAKKGRLSKAIEMCQKGLDKFPEEIDLLSNILKYSSDMGDDETAEKYLNQLITNIPRKVWNWRTYTFTLDYLLKNPCINEAKCREIIGDYKKAFPAEEKSYVAESLLEEKLGNHTKSKEILENAVKERFNAPQCALKLLDLQMEQGEYEEALVTSNYFAIASCETQPSTNQNYQLYARCLIEDALLHKKAFNGENIYLYEIQRIHSLYNRVMKIPEIALNFGANIKNRIVLLNFIKLADD